MIYEVRIGERVFRVEIADIHARPVIAVVDGEAVEVWPEEPEAAVAAPPARPELAPAPAPAVATAEASASAILAPIPGVIVEVSVRPGDRVEAGQPVCVLEAMKMKNTIRAPRAGQLAAVHVSPGAQVRHHDPLMDYAD